MSEESLHERSSANPMATAPRNATLVRLRVNYEIDTAVNALHQSARAWTIGFNNFDNDGEDVWHIAGWDWSHDCFTAGHGQPIGWLPFFDDEPEAAPPVRDDLNAEHSGLRDIIDALLPLAAEGDRATWEAMLATYHDFRTPPADPPPPAGATPGDTP